MKLLYILFLNSTLLLSTSIYAMNHDAAASSPVLYDPELDATQNCDSEEFPLAEPPVVLQKAYFTPHILPIVLKLIHDEQEAIRIVCYRLTHYDIARALATRALDDVATDIIVDSGFQQDHCDGLAVIASSKATLRCHTKRYQSNYETMHHKYGIFNKTLNGKKVLITGSFNCTGQAAHNNWENIAIIEDRETIKAFEQEFHASLQFTRLIAADECKCTTHKSPFSRNLNAIPQPELESLLLSAELIELNK